jgi:hypothetical protein
MSIAARVGAVVTQRSPLGPGDIPRPYATAEFELRSAVAVQQAVEEMKGRGQTFVHEARVEPWGQTVARFVSLEGLQCDQSIERPHAP